MNHIRASILVAGILMSLAATHATPVTLTIITNPPNEGTITGAGTQDSSNKFNVNIQAAYGYYISKFVGGPFSAENNYTHQVLGVQIGAFQQGTIPDYTILTSDSESFQMTSNVTLTVSFSPCWPVFSLEPTNEVAVTGASVSLRAFAYGREPVLCQWFKDGQPLPGANNSNLVFSAAQPTDSGTYTLLTSNIFGFSNSIPAALVVKDILISLEGLPVAGTNLTITTLNNYLSLQSLYANGSMFYSLDGSQPDYSATPYTGPFYVTSNATLRVIAYSADFSQSVLSEPYSLTFVPTFSVYTSTSGEGDIFLDPQQSFFPSNSVVRVMAVPYPGWTFICWNGSVNGAAQTNTMTVDGPKSIQAIFGTPVNTVAVGNGTIVKTPDFPAYPDSIGVTLTAEPASGSYFAAWGNAASGTQNPLPFMPGSPNPTITALFVALPAGQVTLTPLSIGAGAVSVTPAANKYAIGTAVTLSAVPSGVGQTFLRWSGDASGSANPLSVVLDRSKTITAVFSQNTPLFLQLNPLGLMAEGTLGDVYDFQSSTNLRDWETILTATNYGWFINFTDPESNPAPFRVYRAIVH